MVKIISIFDTTLRDGEQAPENSMDSDLKRDHALRLERLGVDTIEAGFPASSDEDRNATCLIAELIKNTKICAFARSKEKDIDIAGESLYCAKRGQIQILGSGSDINLRYKRNMNRKDGLIDAERVINYAKKKFPNLEISFAIEDASRGDVDYLKRLSKVATDSGARVIVLTDTVGCALPTKFGKLVYSIAQELPKDVVLSAHCHNDLGLAVANSISAIENGATEIQTTIGGIGERCGNTQLEAIVMALHLNPELGKTKINKEQLYDTSYMVARTLKRDLAYETPIVGRNAFRTEAGMHQHGILRNPEVYQSFNPSIVGRKQEFYLGKHSGKEGFKYFLEELDINPTEEELSVLIHKAKNSGQYDLNHLTTFYREVKDGAT